jgi:hypothetical protein
MRGNVADMKILGLLLFIPFLAAAECLEFFEAQGAFQYSRQSFGDTCYLSVHPRQVTDLVYRDYLFTSEGELMVFNSFGEGETSKMTAARVFFFFPRAGLPELEIGELQVRVDFSSFSFYFSKIQPRFLRMDGGTVSEAESVKPQNRGGIEFALERGLLLDAGFALGLDPTAIKGGKSIFTDKHGLSCQLTNSEIFRYSTDGDPSFAFSDDELKSFLALRCPQLNLQL